MKYSDFPIIKPTAKSIAFRKLVYGIGINDADYIVQPYGADGKQLRCPIYKFWNHMLERCYDSRWHAEYPTYQSCIVDERWHSFMTFREWVLSQPEWEGLELDKDLLFPGNKVYGPDTCLFVSRQVNQFITSCTKSVGRYPIGVSPSGSCGKWIARVGAGVTGARWYSGRVDTMERAVELYYAKRTELALELASKQTDQRIAVALITQFSK